MVVRELRQGEEAYWDEFVCSCEFSTPQHLSAWKDVMEEVFDSKVHYLLAEENGKITGVLPLIHIKNLLAGHYFTSFPGGLCARDDKTAGLLLDHVKDLVKEENAKYLILRDSRKKWILPDLVTDEEHVTFMVEIQPDLDQTKHSMKKGAQKYVKKAYKNILTASIGLEHLNEFYPIYAKAMHELGTPTLGKDFFKSLASHLPKEMDLITLFHAKQIVGGGVIIHFKETVHCAWSGLLQEYYALSTSYFLMWEVIKHAHEKNYQWVDLGRCRKNLGGYKFKEKFGGVCQQLYQQFFLNGIDRPPNVGGEMKENLKYRFFVSMWRMVPLSIAEMLGPKLRKQMPFG